MMTKSIEEGTGFSRVFEAHRSHIACALSAACLLLALGVSVEPARADKAVTSAIGSIESQDRGLWHSAKTESSLTGAAVALDTRTQQQRAVPPSTPKTEAAKTEPPKTEGEGPIAALPISSAERLSIRFFDYAPLTGEYRVSADESISVPVLGRIGVSKMTAEDLERSLADRVRQVTGREAHVAVEVVEYRPVLVSGSVPRAGSYPWKPGMTVLHAVALSGGLFGEVNTATAVSATGEAGKAARALADLKRNLAVLARLQATEVGADRINVPQRLVELVGREEAMDLIKSQQPIFESDMAALRSQLTTLEQSNAMTEKEMEGLREQHSRIKTQLNLRQRVSDNVAKLKERRIVSEQRSLDELSRVAELEEKSTNIVVAMARLQGVVLGLQRDTEKFMQERRATLSAEMFRLQREVAQLEIDLKSARASYKQLTGHELNLEGIKKRVPTVFEIVRQTAGGPAVIKPERHTLLFPGDLLIVSSQD